MLMLVATLEEVLVLIRDAYAYGSNGLLVRACAMQLRLLGLPC